MSAKKNNNKKKVIEVPIEDLTRMNNTVLLANRPYVGDAIGKHAAFIGGSIIQGVLDPMHGLSQLFGFIGDCGKGAQRGVMTARVVKLDFRSKSGDEAIRAAERKLANLQSNQSERSGHFMPASELEELQKRVAEQEIASAMA